VALVVAGAAMGAGTASGGSGAAGAAPANPPAQAVPARALSSTWACGGATAGASSALAGELLVANAGPSPVTGTVRLVTSDGHAKRYGALVPAGGSTTLEETVPGAAPGAWVAALVTLYGASASVTQEIATHWGRTEQPCASGTSAHWYFPDGYDLRNAGEYLCLVNPFPVDTIADLSFTTNQGAEAPGDFEGIVVPARGMTEVGLGAHLRRRSRIAATVHVRSGRIVAFETELVTTPPQGAPVVGAPGAINPVAPQSGVTLVLGAPAPSLSMWWPAGGEGTGLTETYDIYNPGRRAARAVLDLYTGRPGANGQSASGSDQIEVPAFGWAQVTTNGRPWAFAGTAYSAQLVSTNGAPLVGERSLTAVAPAVERGLGAALGMTGPATSWALPSPTVQAPGAPVPRVSVSAYNPGKVAAVLSVDERGADGAMAPVAGLGNVAVGAGGRATVALPQRALGQGLMVESSRPVLVEQDTLAQRPARGVSLSSALVVLKT
jgi:hypothetical protein